MREVNINTSLQAGVALYDNVDMLGRLEMFSMLGAERCCIHMLSQTGGLKAAAIAAAWAWHRDANSGPLTQHLNAQMG